MELGGPAVLQFSGHNLVDNAHATISNTDRGTQQMTSGLERVWVGRSRRISVITCEQQGRGREKTDVQRWLRDCVDD